jgi:hypothetical protein
MPDPRHSDLGTVAAMHRSDARRLALALRDELWSSASAEPPDDTEDEELAGLVWRALRSAGLAGGA